MYCATNARARRIDKTDIHIIGPGDIFRDAAGRQADDQARVWGQHCIDSIAVGAHCLARVSHGSIQRIQGRRHDAVQGSGGGAGATQDPSQHHFPGICRLGHDEKCTGDQEQARR